MTCSYDVPKDAWYFSEHCSPAMPCCVFFEMVLQACSWLASYVGSPLCSDQDLLFRNLEGEAIFYQMPTAEAGTLKTEVILTDIAKITDTIIERFDVKTYEKEQLIFEMKTKFGFFPESTFKEQKGISIPDHEATVLIDKSNLHIDLNYFK